MPCLSIPIERSANGRKSTTNVAPPYPVKRISFQWVLANVLQQAHKIHLSSGKRTQASKTHERGPVELHRVGFGTKSSPSSTAQKRAQQRSRVPGHHLHDPRNGQIRSPLEAKQSSPDQERHRDVHWGGISSFSTRQSQLLSSCFTLNRELLGLLSRGELTN